MAEKETGIKCRNMMYGQQCEYLPNGTTLQDVYELIIKKLNPDKCACILHDKDVKTDGVTLAEPHIHVMMRFKNARSIKSVAKILGESPEYIEAYRDKNYQNGFSYLIHATDNSRHKHQYDATEVIANFDYPSFIKEVQEKVAKANRANGKRIEYLLNMVATGEMKIREAREEMTGAEYAKNSHLLQKANEKNLIHKAEDLREKLKNNNRTVEVYWIYGETGTGKTRMAISIASGEGEAFYISTTRKDPFQFYAGEQIIILDEMRPDTIYYSELLAMLDPFSYGLVKVTSRYTNKILSCRMFIITTPYSPIVFHKYYNLPATDTGEQLYRRLTTVVELDRETITKMTFDSEKKIYVPSLYKENTFAKSKKGIIKGRDLFELI